MIGFAFCGSFCTLSESLKVLHRLVSDGYEVVPIVSENVYRTDTRFGKAENFRRLIEEICQRQVICDIVGAEPLGPTVKLDALIICPCTGNTLAKLAHGITDTPVTMAAKAHLRSDRPLVIALASNDAMSANLENIAMLMKRKNVYFVPMVQDDPEKKPHSLVADFGQVERTLDGALHSIQVRRVFLEKKETENDGNL